MNNEKVKFYELSDTSTPGLPEENGAISFGVFSNDLGRLYVNNGGGSNSNYLIGESLDKLDVGSDNTLNVPYASVQGFGNIVGCKGWYIDTFYTASHDNSGTATAATVTVRSTQVVPTYDTTTTTVTTLVNGIASLNLIIPGAISFTVSK